MKHSKIAILLLTFLLTFCIVGSAFAAPPEKVDVSAGEPGYVSLHNYVSRTDIPDVYKVTMSVQGSEQQQQQYTDLVILLNTGHMHIYNYQITSPDLTGTTDAFGYVLSASTGMPTAQPRRYASIGRYNIWNAMCYSAEQMIDLMFDPAFNPNYQNCRIAIVSYGNTSTARYDSPVRAGLTGYQDKDFLKKQIGALEALSTGSNNPVPLSKGVQAAYRLLEDEGTELYFDPTLSTSGTHYYPNDFNIPYTGGTVTLPIKEGTWSPLVNPLPANSITERFIVSLHSIGASGPATTASTVPNSTAWQTTYPMNPSVTLLNPLVTDPNTRLSYTDSIVGTFREGPGTGSGSVYAYNWARYNVLEVNSRLAPRNSGKKPYQTFALWIDPDQTSIAYSALGRWMDFNETISQFSIPASTDPTHPFAGSGWQPYSQRISGSGKALYYYNDQGPLFGNNVYEGPEGVQYWSDAGVFRNVYSYTTLENELTDFISSISALVGNKDGVVKASIASPFALYAYPGEALLAASQGTATAQGNNITWDIGDITAETFTLTFYVKMDSASASADLSYPVFSEAYATYNMDASGTITAQCKYFPMPHIKLGGEITTESGEQNGGSEQSGSGGKDGPEGGNMMPLFALPYESVTVHSPSVTPSRQVVDQGNLQEREEPVIEGENIADGGEEIPVASTDSQGYINGVLIATFVLLATIFAAVALRRRKG